jgi:Fe-S cluster assembly protein SufB
MAEEKSNDILDEVTQSEYKYGFYTDIEMDQAPKGLTRRHHPFHIRKKE